MHALHLEASNERLDLHILAALEVCLIQIVIRLADGQHAIQRYLSLTLFLVVRFHNLELILREEAFGVPMAIFNHVKTSSASAQVYYLKVNVYGAELLLKFHSYFFDTLHLYMKSQLCG